MLVALAFHHIPIGNLQNKVFSTLFVDFGWGKKLEEPAILWCGTDPLTQLQMSQIYGNVRPCYLKQDYPI